MNLSSIIDCAMRSRGASQSLDGCHYAYFVTHKSRQVKPRIFSNYPERWLEVYKTADYHLIDPVINHGMKCIAPFSWREALESTKQGNAKTYLHCRKHTDLNGIHLQPARLKRLVRGIEHL